MIDRFAGKASTYELLAEEASELAKSALKVARVMRAEEPTPVTIGEAEASLVEELTDVRVVSDALGLVPDERMYSFKVRRWLERYSENS